jgi:hypothetical protein
MKIYICKALEIGGKGEDDYVVGAYKTKEGAIQGFENWLADIWEGEESKWAMFLQELDVEE